MVYSYSDKITLRKAAAARLTDAKTLLTATKPRLRGAMYLAGYAVECWLKVTAMERFGCKNLDELMKRRRLENHEVFQHRLESLAAKFDLAHAISKSNVHKDFVNQLNGWSSEWRYNPQEPAKAEIAKDFVESAVRIVKWLENNPGAGS